MLFGRPGKAAGHCAGGRATPEPTTRRPWSGQNPFAIDGLRVSSRVAGGGGPRDRAHGGGAFGAVERVHSRWRWTFQDVGPSVVGGWRYAGAAATAELMAAQSLLFPSDLPTEDWFDPKRRAAHPRRVKISARGRQARAAPAIRQRGPHLHSRLAFPRDARAPSNDFLGFYNLRNARYSSAVLRCIFQYEPLVSDPPLPVPPPGVVEAKLRALFAEHVAPGASTMDARGRRVYELLPRAAQRRVRFAPFRRRDAAECSRQLLQRAGFGWHRCDSRARVADGEVAICRALEVARVSAAASLVDAAALAFTAAPGDGAPRVGARARVGHARGERA